MSEQVSDRGHDSVGLIDPCARRAVAPNSTSRYVRRVIRERSAALALALALLSMAACGPQASPAASPEPPIELGWSATHEGEPIVLPNQDRITGEVPAPTPGQPVLLNYWASTCPPCRKEMPLLERLSGRGVLVVGVTSDRYESFAKDAIEAAGVTYANFQDFDQSYTSSQLTGVIPARAVPSSVLMLDGKIQKVYVGPFHRLADLQPVIDLLPLMR